MLSDYASRRGYAERDWVRLLRLDAGGRPVRHTIRISGERAGLAPRHAAAVRLTYRDGERMKPIEKRRVTGCRIAGKGAASELGHAS